jgi:gluconokinase
MGVAGAGKTLVGRALSAELGWPFLDADEFHSPENIAKMESGSALEDADRAAWLDALRTALTRVRQREGDAVLACSALGAAFRASLRAGLDEMRFVYLKADAALVRARVAAREDHFMPASLVESQFEALEEPDDAIVIDASQSPEAIVSEVLAALKQA